MTDNEEEIIDEHVGDGGAYESKSEFVRTCIQHHNRVEELEARVDDLRQQLQIANAKDDRVDQLATYVEEERRVEQRWREAGMLTKTKWRLFGMPTGEEA